MANTAASKALAEAKKTAPPPPAPPPTKEKEEVVDPRDMPVSDLSDEELKKRLYDILKVSGGSSFANRSDVRREIIERTLSPLSFDRYINDGFVVQAVSPRDGITFVFRSTNGYEEEFLRRRLGLMVGEMREHVDHQAAVLNLSLTLIEFNSVPLEEHRQKDGSVNSEAFDRKLAEILRLGVHLQDEAIVQASWFGQRVNKMLLGIDVKNG